MPESERMTVFAEKMKELGLENLVVYFDGMHAFTHPLAETNIVFYLSGFKSLGECALVLHADQAPSLIVAPSWDADRARRKSNTWHVVGTEDAAQTLLAYMKSRRMVPERTGFIGSSKLTVSGTEALASYCGGRLLQMDETFVPLTSRKSAQDLEKARKATWIAERGYEKMLEMARPGIYEYQLAAEIDTFMKSLGADDNFLLLSASQHNQAVRSPTRRRLEKGDIILAEISPSYEGQFSQICRTVVLGEENRSRLDEKYDLLVHAYESGLAAAKPGEAMSGVFQAMNEVIVGAGYGNYCGPFHMRVRGHGLGLGSSLPGDVARDNANILEEDMFLVVHPNQYIPETGYLLCGEPVHIASAGGTPLSARKPSIEYIVC